MHASQLVKGGEDDLEQPVDVDPAMTDDREGERLGARDLSRPPDQVARGKVPPEVGVGGPSDGEGQDHEKERRPGGELRRSGHPPRTGRRPGVTRLRVPFISSVLFHASGPIPGIHAL